MLLPRKKVFTYVSVVFIGLLSFSLAITAYQGTLIFEGETVHLSLLYSILVGLVFFICMYALSAFITFLVYTVFGEAE